MESVNARKQLSSEAGGLKVTVTLDPSDHEAMFLAVVGHEDDVAVGGPDEPGEFEGVLRSGRRRLDRRNLIGFDAAELRSRIQHPDAS